MTQRRRPAMRSMTAGRIQGPPGVQSLSNARKSGDVKNIEINNRFDDIAPKDEDEDEIIANCSCGYDHRMPPPPMAASPPKAPRGSSGRGQCGVKSRHSTSAI